MTQSARTWPYRRASPKRLHLDPWRLVVEGAPRLGENLEDWDPGTDVHLSRHIRLDVTALRADCGLAPDAALRLAASWWCEGTTLRNHGTRIGLPLEGSASLNVELGLTGSDLSGVVHLQTSVVLAEKITRKPVTAYLPGTVLWEETQALRLEGGGARFPMDAISFSQNGMDFPSAAAWRLEWDPEDLELPVLSTVRLHLNQDHALMRAVVEKPDDPKSRVVVAAIQFDVARSMLKSALGRDDLIVRKQPWPADSIGNVLDLLLKLRFNGFSAATLKAMLQNSPDRFDALLQDRLGLFRHVG